MPTIVNSITNGNLTNILQLEITNYMANQEHFVPFFCVKISDICCNIYLHMV